ncbi:MAG: DUF3098 domain-containing protein [Bacteroidota bacterium]
MAKKKTTSRKVTTRSGAAEKVAPARQKSATRSKRNQPEEPVELPFSRMNYILLAVGIGIIGLGFLLMSMDPFIDSKQFSISLYIAPPVVVLGFIEVIYAIMYKPKDADTLTAVDN